MERLIALLDAMDGDPDREPWLADTDPASKYREGDDDGEPNDWDTEPSLGWPLEKCPRAPGWSYDGSGDDDA